MFDRGNEVLHQVRHKQSIKSKEMYINIDFDIYKYIECANTCRLDWYETRMAVMHEEVTTQSPRGEVIHTTRPIGHVAHHDRLDMGKFAQDISYHAGVDLQSLRELQSHPLGLGSNESPHGLYYFKIVVRWQNRNSVLEERILRDLLHW